MGGRYTLSGNSSLLLVVYRFAGDLFARRIGSGYLQRAGLAVRRHDNATASDRFAVLLVSKLQRAIVNLLVRPFVRGGIAGKRIVFAIEFACPLGVHWLAFSVGAIRGHFHTVTRGRVDNRRVLHESGRDLRLGLVELPGAHVWVVGKTRGYSYKTQSQG